MSHMNGACFKAQEASELPKTSDSESSLSKSLLLPVVVRKAETCSLVKSNTSKAHLLLRELVGEVQHEKEPTHGFFGKLSTN